MTRSHVVARRGLRAQIAKTLKVHEPEQLDTEGSELSQSHSTVSLEELRLVVRIVPTIGCFPNSVKLALTANPVDNSAPLIVHTFLAGIVFSFLARSDLDETPSRPLLAPCVPSIFHPSKLLLKSPAVGEGIVRLCSLIERTVLSTNHDPIQLCSDLILSLFLVGVLPEEKDWSDAERIDSTTVASPLCLLIWITHLFEHALHRSTAAVVDVMDDTYTSKSSPYNGLRLSHPTWDSIHSPLVQAFAHSVGIPKSSTVIPRATSGPQPSEFIGHVLLSLQATDVMRACRARALSIVNSFNSRKEKSVLLKPSGGPSGGGDVFPFQSMLMKPWMDHVEVRAISATFRDIITLVRSAGNATTAESAVFANVLIGFWRGIAGRTRRDANNDLLNKIEEGKDCIVWRDGAVNACVEEYRILTKSIKDVSESFLLRLNQYRSNDQVVARVKRVQSVWRGRNIRNSHLSLIALSHYMQNTNWPDPTQSVVDGDTWTVDLLPPSGSDVTAPSGGLTRASLMRLVPSVNKQSDRPTIRPTTPTPSTITAVTLHNRGGAGSVVSAGTDRLPADLIQADHMACAKLYFVAVYSLSVRNNMERTFAALLKAYERVVVAFTALVNKQPEYAEAMRAAAAECRRKAVMQSAQAGGLQSGAGQRPKPLGLVNRLAQEMEQRLLSKPIPTGGGATNSLKAYLVQYRQLHNGDDSLFRDIPLEIDPSSVRVSESSVWITLKQTKFSLARSRILSILKTPWAKSQFEKLESELRFLECLALLKDTAKGSLNVFAAPPGDRSTGAEMHVLWTELVYHVLAGWVAMLVKQQGSARESSDGLTVVVAMVDSYQSWLGVGMHPIHRAGIECCVLDAAVGFAFAYPEICRPYIQNWVDGLTQAHSVLQQPIRFARSCIRCSYVLNRVGMHAPSVTSGSAAVETLISLGTLAQNSAMMVLAKTNRLLSIASRGEIAVVNSQAQDVMRSLPISGMDAALVTSLTELVKAATARSSRTGRSSGKLLL